MRAFIFIAHVKGFSILTARRPPSNVANSQSPAFRYSIFKQEKVITHEYALGETRTHQDVDLPYYSRHADHLPSHRGRRHRN